MEEESTYLEKLIATVSSFPETAMKLAYVKKSFGVLEPDFIAVVLNLLYTDRPDSGGVRELKALFVDPASLDLLLGKEKFRSTCLCAMVMDFERITPFFTKLAPLKSASKQDVREEDGNDTYETLGARRTLSKGSMKDTLDKLLLDTDPMIIGNLLSNPRIVRGQVLKIATARPAMPNILVLIAKHGKWGKEYGIRLALVNNPYSPPRLALALLELLNKTDQKKVAMDQTLHGQVRRSALAILEADSDDKIGKTDETDGIDKDAEVDDNDES